MSDLPKDPMSTLIEKGIEEGLKAAKDYLDKLVGPGLGEAGGLIGDTVAYWRFKNKLNLVLKTKALLEAKGIEPKRLIPNVVLPLLDYASLEENKEMQARWATLLKSAAAEPTSVPPAFPRILSELSSTEAQILEWMVLRVEHEVGWITTGREIRGAHRLSTSQYEVLMGNLVRLNLFRPAVVLHDENIGPGMEWVSYQEVELTRLGIAFVRACRPSD